MGFLDHSTNNIIVDAVLTDTGRRFLARNDGSFSIVKFAMADDEVDYSIIKQFGRTVGKEKISKNALVLEAQTNGGLALKYRLLSISNPNLVRLPSFAFKGLSTTSPSVSMTRGQITGRTTSNVEEVIIEQSITDVNSVDIELVDNAFLVSMRNDFIRLAKGGTALTPQDLNSDRMATYFTSRDAALTAKGGARLTIQLQTKSITDSQFTTFGNYNSKATITTFVEFTGLSSGQRTTLQIDISKT